MKIAIISTKPASLSSGAEVRIFYLRKGLKKEFNVDFFMPKNDPSFDFLTRFKDLLQGKIPYFEYVKKATLSNKEIDEIKRADFIQIEELETFYAIEKYLKMFNKPIVLDAHNIEFKKFLAGTETENFIIKWIGRILAIKIKKLEIKALNNIDYILTCSEVDKEYFAKYKVDSHICCVPNGVIRRSIPATSKGTPNILFMGLLSYGPNAQGIQYYIDKIHPLVKRSLPHSTLTIIGRNPPEWLKARAKVDSTMIVKGFVDSVEAELANATVCICPVLYGSGTRLKILEYMAAAKPVVSTTVGAEGINATPGKEILIADDPINFANNVIGLIQDVDKASRIGTSAKVFTEKNYNWEAITAKLSKFYTAQFNSHEDTTHK